MGVCLCICLFLFKQKTEYEMRISDWSSDVCSSDLISVQQTFGLDCEMHVPAFSQPSEHVPDLDEAYRFDHDTTLAILAGFAYNRRVMIQEIGRASCRERVCQYV